jgi:hypothetical protein
MPRRLRLWMIGRAAYLAAAVFGRVTKSKGQMRFACGRGAARYYAAASWLINGSASRRTQEGAVQTFDAWVMAAAILVTERELHYRILADRVVDTGLSTLGLKGSTPPQTLGVILRQHNHIFISYGRGCYCLKSSEEVAKLPVVARAIDALKLLEKERQSAGELQALRAEVQKLKERNALLERKIAEIAEICNPLADA